MLPSQTSTLLDLIMSKENPPAPHGDAHVSAAPPKLPHPTVWPAAVALGATLLAWGLISSLIVVGIGLVLFAWALVGWIREIRHERNT
jgi:hypothetical protein